MTTDRELLEAAARAAGYGLPTESDTDEIGRQYTDSLGLWVCIRRRWGWWNPREDDGDALRLAVRLGLSVHVLPAMKLSWASFNGGHTTYNADHGTDPYAATRRAIVRAAAGITPG